MAQKQNQLIALMWISGQQRCLRSTQHLREPSIGRSEDPLPNPRRAVRPHRPRRHLSSQAFSRLHAWGQR